MAAVGDRAHVDRPPSGPRRAVRFQEAHRRSGALLQLCEREHSRRAVATLL